MEYGLGLEVEVVNVIKYVALSLILSPILEVSFCKLLGKMSMCRVERGREVTLKSSRLGRRGLHAERDLSRRTSLLLILPVTVIYLSASLLVEFGFGGRSS